MNTLTFKIGSLTPLHMLKIWINNFEHFKLRLEAMLLDNKKVLTKIGHLLDYIKDVRFWFLLWRLCFPYEKEKEPNATKVAKR